MGAYPSTTSDWMMISFGALVILYFLGDYIIARFGRRKEGEVSSIEPSVGNIVFFIDEISGFDGTIEKIIPLGSYSVDGEAVLLNKYLIRNRTNQIIETPPIPSSELHPGNSQALVGAKGGLWIRGRNRRANGEIEARNQMLEKTVSMLENENMSLRNRAQDIMQEWGTNFQQLKKKIGGGVFPFLPGQRGAPPIGEEGTIPPAPK